MISYRPASPTDPCLECKATDGQAWLDAETSRCAICRNFKEKAIPTMPPTAPDETPLAHEFFWFDLETTGLSSADDVILEWALVLAEDGREGDMSAVREYHSPISTATFAHAGQDRQYKAALAAMDPYVRNMHTQNGLLEACAAETVTISEVDDFLAGLCAELGAKKRGVSLAGNSVHFDLGFCRVHLPRFTEYLSHRVFDVSTLIRAERTYGSEQLRSEPAHRALADVHQSLATAAAWRKARGL